MNLSGEMAAQLMTRQKLKTLLADFETENILVKWIDPERRIPMWSLTDVFLEQLDIEIEKTCSENNNLSNQDNVRLAAIRTILRFYADSTRFRGEASAIFELLAAFIETYLDHCKLDFFATSRQKERALYS